MSRLSILLFLPLMSSPSTGRKSLASAQDVRLSDVATWMSHRSDNYFLKRAGNGNDFGAFSFAYFYLGKQRKVRPAAGIKLSECD